MTCIDVLKDIVDTNIHKESFLNLCQSYYNWDRMEFEKAYNHLTEVNLSNFEFRGKRN